jgi:hypothetical protein
MKILLASGATAALLVVCAIASAQDESTHSTTYQTDQGQLTVNWGQPPAQAAGPAPDFAQLDSDGNGSISRDEASGYALLANDFIHADGNRNGAVSRAEYTRWTGEP